MRIDLHTHSTASDGELEPIALLDYAKSKNIEVMSITDHDSVSAYEEAGVYAQNIGIELITGVEFSSYWQQGKMPVHIVGLNIRTDHSVISQAVEQQSHTRMQRAERIAAKLASRGLNACLEGALSIAGHRHIGRVHFAHYLQQQGWVKDINMAFKKYLATGKIGGIDHCWPDMVSVVEWIHAAGGVAVLAHPAKYRLSNAKLKRLLLAFTDSGGDAMEVISSGQSPDLTQYLAQLSRDFELAASIGSDFHRLGLPWQDMGKNTELPSGCEPVWERWQD